MSEKFNKVQYMLNVIFIIICYYVFLKNISDNEQNLLGVFEGIPLIDRYNDQSYMPDVITIYEKPLIEISNSIEELKVNIRETVLHEVAHYFGIDDGDLEKMGRY